jgi:LPS sulfotransferase NodH
VFDGDDGTRTVMTKFAVLSLPRSGSTWVVEMLNSHPAVVAYGELLLPTTSGTSRWGATDFVYFTTFAEQNGGGRNPVARAALPLRYMSELYAPRDGIDAVGFKLMYGHVRSRPWLLPYMALRRVQVVHLIRRNTLDVVLSRETARRRPSFHARENGHVADVTVRLDPAELVASLRREEKKVNAARAVIRAAGLRSKEFYYEDLVADPDRFEEMLTFLDVRLPEYRLSSSLVKLNRAPYDRIIENYDSVKQTLESTRFGALLAERD